MSQNNEAAPDWSITMLEEYKKGAADVEVAASLNMTTAAFEDNYKKNALFRKVVDLGRQLSQAWWYAQGRTNLTNKAFNTSLWGFNMKNRHGWAEKTETSTKDDEEQNLEAVHAKMLQKLPELIRKFGGEASVAEVLEATSV